MTMGIAGTIGADIIKYTFNNAISTLCSTLLFIKNGSHENELFENVNEKIKNYDLEMQFKLAQQYTEKCNDEILSSYIITSINNINNIIESIRLKINNHGVKWFHKYRYCDIETDLRRLDSETKIFEKRLDTAFKIFSLNSH
jgi:hypothetical protein